jgi:hypothetical protein
VIRRALKNWILIAVPYVVGRKEEVPKSGVSIRIHGQRTQVGELYSILKIQAFLLIDVGFLHILPSADEGR